MHDQGEAGFLAAVAKVFTRRQSDFPDLLVGIGDDAAVINSAGKKIVLTTDLAVEGVHFRRDWSTYFQIGQRVATANLADVIAMGARPTFLLVGVVLPRDITLAEVGELAAGIESKAAQAHALVIGGDISRGPALMISITALGAAERIVTRAGARPGDLIAISGYTGRSMAGYHSLINGDAASEFVSQYLAPVIDFKLATAALSCDVGAMCDVSDGLVSELTHISLASNVAAILQPDIWPALPVSEFEFLNGGEDHILLATFAGEVPLGWIRVGVIESGGGVYIEREERAPIAHKGFSHF
jgi:thiamine-monophosphate kinase